MKPFRLIFLALFFLFQVLPVPGEEPPLQTISRLCGKCHGLTLNDQCIAGPCDRRASHPVRPLPWDLVIPWMKALGSEINPLEETNVTRYLMAHFGKSFPNRWEKTGTVPGGWNVVSFGTFQNRLYAGMEGNGSILRFEPGAPGGAPSWKTVFQSSGYTVYGLTPFQGKLYAVTHDPSAEIWRSADGEKWELSGKLPEEKGLTSVGLFKGFIYAGTARSSFYRSREGTVWEPLPPLIPDAEPAYPNWIRFILPFEGALYAGTEKGGVFRTEDGTTWNQIWPVRQDPPLNRNVTGARGAAVFKGVLYFGTTSGGEIWALGSKVGPYPVRLFAPDSSFSGKYLSSMTVFGDFLYAGIGGTVLRTREGSLWEEAGYLTPFTIEAMAVLNDDLYAGTSLPPEAWIYRTHGEGERLSKEITLSVRPADEEEDPVAAWGEKEMLAVWQTTRQGPTRIYGARLSRSGELLQPDGFPVSDSPKDQLFPALAWGDQSYLVVWQDLRGGKNWEIYGARIDSKGRRLDRDDIPVGTGTGNRKHPAVAWNGKHFLVVWMEERPETGWDIVGKELTPDGTVLSQEEIRISVSRGNQTSPVVARQGNDYFAAWMDDRNDPAGDIYGTRIDRNGKVLDPAGRVISAASGEQGYPALAAHGNGIIVVWADRRNGSQYALYGTRIGRKGEVLDPEGIPLSITPRLHIFPDISCRERECLLVWEEEIPSGQEITGIQSILRDVNGLRLKIPENNDAVISVSAPFPILPEGVGNHFARVSTDGKNFLVIWKDYRSGRAGSFGRLIE